MLRNFETERVWEVYHDSHGVLPLAINRGDRQGANRECSENAQCDIERIRGIAKIAW